jgi:hypothetical protein
MTAASSTSHNDAFQKRTWVRHPGNHSNKESTEESDVRKIDILDVKGICFILSNKKF